MACTYIPKEGSKNVLNIDGKIDKAELAALVYKNYDNLGLNINKGDQRFINSLESYSYLSKAKAFRNIAKSTNKDILSNLSIDNVPQNLLNDMASRLVKDSIERGDLKEMLDELNNSSANHDFKIMVKVNAYGEHALEIAEAVANNDTETLKKYQYLVDNVKNEARDAGRNLRAFYEAYKSPIFAYIRLIEEFEGEKTQEEEKIVNGVTKGFENIKVTEQDIDNIVEKVVAASTQSPKKPKISGSTMEIKLALKDKIAELKDIRDAKKLKGSDFKQSSIIGLDSADIEFAAAVIAEYVKAGVKNPKAIVEFVKEQFGDQDLRDIDYEVFRLEAEEQLAQKAYTDKIESLNKNITDLNNKIDYIKANDALLPIDKKVKTEKELTELEKQLHEQIDALKETYKEEQNRVKGIDAEQKRIDNLVKLKEEKQAILEATIAGVQTEQKQKRTNIKELKGLEKELTEEIKVLNEAIAAAKKVNAKTDSLLKQKEQLQNKLFKAQDVIDIESVDADFMDNDIALLTEHQQQIQSDIDELKQQIKADNQKTALVKVLEAQLQKLEDAELGVIRETKKKGQAPALSKEAQDIRQKIADVKEQIKAENQKQAAIKKDSFIERVKAEGKKIAKTFNEKDVKQSSVMEDFVKRVSRMVQQRNQEEVFQQKTQEERRNERAAQLESTIEDKIKDFKIALTADFDIAANSIIYAAVDEVMNDPSLTDEQKQQYRKELYDKLGVASSTKSLPDKAVKDYVKSKLLLIGESLSLLGKAKNIDIDQVLSNIEHDLANELGIENTSEIIKNLREQIMDLIQKQAIKDLSIKLRNKETKDNNGNRISPIKVKFAEQQMLDLIWQGALSDEALSSLVANALGRVTIDQDTKASLLKAATDIRKYHGTWANRENRLFKDLINREKGKALKAKGVSLEYIKHQSKIFFSGLAQLMMIDMLSGVSTNVVAAVSTALNTIITRARINQIGNTELGGTELTKEQAKSAILGGLNIPSRIYHLGKATIDTISDIRKNKDMIKEMSFQALKDGFNTLEGDIEANRSVNWLDRIMDGKPFTLPNTDIFKYPKTIFKLLTYIPQAGARGLLVTDIIAHSGSRDFFIEYEYYRKLIDSITEDDGYQKEILDFLVTAQRNVDSIKNIEDAVKLQYKTLKEGYSIPFNEIEKVYEEVYDELASKGDVSSADVIEEARMRLVGKNDKSKINNLFEVELKEKLKEYLAITKQEALRLAREEYKKYKQEGMSVVESDIYARSIEIEADILIAQDEFESARQRVRDNTEQKDPTGLLGVIHSGIFKHLQKYMLSNMIVLFTRSTFNVINKVLDYSGYGIKRAAFGTFGDKKFTTEQRMTSLYRASAGAAIMAYLLYAGSDSDEDDKDKWLKDLLKQAIYININGRQMMASDFGVVGDKEPTVLDAIAKKEFLPRADIESGTVDVTIFGQTFRMKTSSLPMGNAFAALADGFDYEKYRLQRKEPLTKAEFTKIVALNFTYEIIQAATRGYFSEMKGQSTAGKIGQTLSNFTPTNASIYKDMTKSYKVIMGIGQDQLAINKGQDDSDLFMEKLWLGFSRHTPLSFLNKKAYDSYGRPILINAHTLPGPLNPTVNLIAYVAGNVQATDGDKMSRFDNFAGPVNFAIQQKEIVPPAAMSVAKFKEYAKQNKLEYINEEFNYSRSLIYGKMLKDSEAKIFDRGLSYKQMQGTVDYIKKVSLGIAKVNYLNKFASTPEELEAFAEYLNQVEAEKSKDNEIIHDIVIDQNLIK